MSKRTLLVLGAFALAAGLFALTQLAGRAGDGDVKLVVPEAAAPGMVTDDIKIVNDALKDKDEKKDEKKAPLPKDVKRAKVAALDIALTAKASKNDALYAQALKVLDALNALMQASGAMGWFVRTNGGTETVSGTVQNIVRQETGVPVTAVQGMDDIVSVSIP